ncbi:TIGR00153 family protein [Archaeoglobus neptunius]|uniref:TIGR00153 family protein n=1 Tax=Archaeoglobus neptunius TaxID=2798580 RepID=UPI001E517BB4|nr:TIGR00153 family protein [Archaeoglobus neptunius]
MKFFRSVGEVFGYSPFRSLAQHARMCGRAVGLLQQQFEALKREDYEEVEELRDEIDELEHHADGIKEEIRGNVTKSLMLPIDRHDLLEFLKVQDDIVNNCEHVGHMLTFRRIKAPKDVWDEFSVLLSKLMEIVNHYEEMVESIGQLIETSFSKKEVKKALDFVPIIEQLEHECDLIQIGLHNRLFNMDDAEPLDIQLMVTWVVHLGYVANAAAAASDRFRIMILGR